MSEATTQSGASPAAARPRAGAPALEVRGLSAGYRRGDPVIADVSFAIGVGSMAALVGPNGAGKSTLLRALVGLVPLVLAERIAFFGSGFEPSRRRIAYIPQRSQLYWDFPATAIDVVAMGAYARLGLFRRAGRQTREEARAALAEVGLADAAGAQVGALSGGQQQRVLVARALMQEADLLLLDEPFTNVDAFSESRLASSLRTLAGLGRTILAVHHDLRSVRAHFDEAILLNRGVVAQGPVADVMTDAMLARAYGFRAGNPS